MNHLTASEKLLDLAYGELDPREAREVEAHAQGCDACRQELARIRETRALMAQLPVEPPPERGEGIVLAAARQAAEARKPKPLLPAWLWAGTAGAMAAAVVAVVSWQLTRAPTAELHAQGEAELLGRGGPAPAPPASPPASVGGLAPAADADVLEKKKGVSPHERVASEESAPSVAKRAAPKRAEPAKAFAVRPPEERDEGTGGLGLAHGRGSAGGAGAAAPAGNVWGPAPAEPAPAPAMAKAKAERPPVPQAAPPPAPPPAARAEAERASAPVATGAPTVARSAPAQKAREAQLAERKSAVTADSAKDDFADAGPTSLRTRNFSNCPGEQVRAVVRDAEGRIVRYTRIGDQRSVEHRYGPDGRLRAAFLTEGGVRSALPLDAPGLVQDARDAGIDAPPRCSVP